MTDLTNDTVKPHASDPSRRNRFTHPLGTLLGLGVLACCAIPIVASLAAGSVVLAAIGVSAQSAGAVTVAIGILAIAFIVLRKRALSRNTAACSTECASK